MLYFKEPYYYLDVENAIELNKKTWKNTEKYKYNQKKIYD
jgi:hypothetical protein